MIHCHVHSPSLSTGSEKMKMIFSQGSEEFSMISIHLTTKTQTQTYHEIKHEISQHIQSKIKPSKGISGSEKRRRKQKKIISHIHRLDQGDSFGNPLITKILQYTPEGSDYFMKQRVDRTRYYRRKAIQEHAMRIRSKYPHSKCPWMHTRSTPFCSRVGWNRASGRIQIKTKKISNTLSPGQLSQIRLMEKKAARKTEERETKNRKLNRKLNRKRTRNRTRKQDKKHN